MNEPIQSYVSTKCALYCETYGHEDLEMLIDELNKGIRNLNVKRIMTEHEFASIPENTKKAMFAVTLVTKQLKWGITSSASVQLPHYDGVEPMEIGTMAVGLHQLGKAMLPAEPTKSEIRCYTCQGYGQGIPTRAGPTCLHTEPTGNKPNGSAKLAPERAPATPSPQ